MKARSSAPSDLVELGYVSGVFGVRGEVRLFLHNRDSEALGQPVAVVLLGPSGGRRELRLRVRSGAGGRVIGRLEGVEDRDAAAALRGWRVAIRAGDLPGLGPGEWYVRDLLEAEVRVEGQVVGRVVGVHDHGPVALIEVRRPDGSRAFAPLLDAKVVAIDPAAGRVELAPDALVADP